MAVIKVAPGKASLGKIINYAAKDKITSGIDCPDDKEKAKEQFQNTQEVWGKTEGRRYKHYVQSFKPGEISPAKAHDLGREWAEKSFPGHEVFVGTHVDKDHIHNHFVVNSVNYENGKKLHVGNEDLERFKAVSDEICKEHGLSIVDRAKERERGEIRAYEMKKYRTLERAAKGEVKSHIANTAIAVNKSLETARSKKEFIKAMNDRGYMVDWQESHKHITFTDQEGHKVRASNLAKTFSDDRYTKEGIEHEIARRREYEQPERTGRDNSERIDSSTVTVPGAGTIDIKGKPYIEIKSDRGQESQGSGRNHDDVRSPEELRKRLDKLKRTPGRAGQENSRAHGIQQNVKREHEGHEL